MKLKSFILILIILSFLSVTLNTVSSTSIEQTSQNISELEKTQQITTKLDPTGQKIFDELVNRVEKSKSNAAANAAKTNLGTGMRQLGFSESEIETTLANITWVSTISLKKGVIYEDKKSIGVWDGKSAYVLNSAGKLVKSTSYTTQTRDAIGSGKIISSKLSTKDTSKIVKFTNNVVSGKILSSAAYSLSRILTNHKKGTLAFRALSYDIAIGNFNNKRFSKFNIYISTNAVKKVLNEYGSNKYIGRKSISVNGLKSASKKGATILRTKSKDNKWRFITISKLSKGKVTVFDNKKSNKVSINSIKSYLKKNYKSVSGTAITFAVKIGKTPNTKHLNSALGI